MKRIYAIVASFCLAFTSQAQIKVWTDGKAAFGSTSSAPIRPIDVKSAGGIRISQTANADTTNELYFQDNGQIRSSDNNHRIIFDRSNNILELREFYDIVFSPGSSSGTRTQKMTFNRNGHVGIGISSLTPKTRFDLYYDSTSAFSSGPVYGGHFVNAGKVSGSTNPYVYGVYASANAVETNTAAYHYGLAGSATNAPNCVGVSGVAVSSNSGGLTYGGYFNGSCTSGNVYGIYATAPVRSASYAAWLNGNVYVNGSGTYTGTWSVSDKNFKTKIDSIVNPLNIIKKLKPHSYFFDTTSNPGMNFTSAKQYGFIAQEVQLILPELVRTATKPAEISPNGQIIQNSVNHLALNYNGFIALLTAAMQSQQKQLDSLKQALAVCCNANRGSTNRTGFNTQPTDVNGNPQNRIINNQEDSNNDISELKKLIEAQQKDIEALKKQNAELSSRVEQLKNK